ncbi:MAG: agmatinase [Thermodesulfobacteriota bacterium]|nr:agmatinase [Thermodesulfobacteriota bacterium]
MFGPFNFGGLTEEFSRLDTSKVVILPVPYDQTVSFRSGAREGPRAIINASAYMELYDEELLSEFYKVGIHTLNELEPDMSGPEGMVRRVYDIVTLLIKKGKLLVMLGGEHSLTIGSVKAFIEEYKDLSVLQLDAHADLRDSYCETKYNHATVMRRILEYSSTVQVGMRSISSEEMELIHEKKLPVFFETDLIKSEDLIDEIISHLSPNVYITVDLDVLDPAIMPSVGTPEPGGLSWHGILSIVREVAKKRNIVGFDVMELCPIPGLLAPDFLAAKLVYKMLGYSLFFQGKD